MGFCGVECDRNDPCLPAVEGPMMLIPRVKDGCGEAIISIEATLEHMGLFDTIERSYRSCYSHTPDHHSGQPPDAKAAARLHSHIQ